MDASLTVVGGTRGKGCATLCVMFVPRGDWQLFCLVRARSVRGSGFGICVCVDTVREKAGLADESNNCPGQKDDDSPNPINERYVKTEEMEEWKKLLPKRKALN